MSYRQLVIRLFQQMLSTEHELNANTVGYGSAVRFCYPQIWLSGMIMFQHNVPRMEILFEWSLKYMHKNSEISNLKTLGSDFFSG